MAHAWKACWVQALRGSNPLSSAISDCSSRVVNVNAEQNRRTPSRRIVVRRRRRERQILLFGLISIVLAAVTFAAMAIYRGDVESPWAAPIYTPPSEFESDVRLACPPTDSYPVNEAEIPLRVYNGTNTQGLAGSVATTLEGRNFYIVSIGNASRSYEHVARISYGTEGLVKAYTLARHFEEVELVLDTREGGVIDITLGARFDVTMIRPLLAPELNADTPLSPYAQCLPLSLIVAEPAPRNIPDDPLAPEASPLPEDDDVEGDPDGITD